jgi:nucleotide-binding universal stress UspA family protein
MGTALKTIVIATDGSEDARDVERVAVELCCQTGAALHVVHAWQYHPVAHDAYAMPLGESDYQIYEEAANAIWTPAWHGSPPWAADRPGTISVAAPPPCRSQQPAMNWAPICC